MTPFVRFESQFKSKELLQQALTHKSHASKVVAKVPFHNERLEYLGDAVLDMLIAEYLYNQFPELDEGQLSKKRAFLVKEETLAQIALGLALDASIRLGKGERKMGGHLRNRILASTFEALVGALYLDSGLRKTKKFVQLAFRPHLEALKQGVYQDHDFKTQLQEWTQRENKLIPHYQIIEQTGPSHDRSFVVGVFLLEKQMGVGQGRNKKQAEQEAARMALEKINL